MRAEGPTAGLPSLGDSKGGRQMVATGQSVFEYRLDPGDAIDYVSDPWLAFARENGAPQLVAQAVLGRSIWEFIADQPTRDLYRQVFTAVRATDRPAVVPFRCDSPTLRRFMRLEIRHEPGCGIKLKSILVRAEPCARQPLLDIETPHSDKHVTMCSCCKQVLIEPQGWVPLEAANRHPHVCPDEHRPNVHYEVCPACSALVSTCAG